MTMLEMSRHICRRRKCGDNCRARGSLVELLTENINNPLPPELLCRILGSLPQDVMVGNRSVCKYWRDTIDQHCPVTVTFEKDDEFLYQKLQQRISKCVINSLPKKDSKNVKFAYPQSMRSIKFEMEDCWRNVRRLLNQVKPYLHSLEINNRGLEKNIFTPPYVFPLVRELTITSPTWCPTPISVLPVNLDVLISLRMPSLTILDVFFIECDFHVAEELHKRLFILLSIHRQSIKRLDVFIETKKELQPEFPEMFELPTEMKSLLCNGQLQLEHLELSLPLPSRYLSAWISILKSQKNLIHLSVGVSEFGRCSLGIPFNVILPGIQSSIATLQTLFLENILSVDHDGRNWIPFDCSVYRGTSNLTKLSLERNWSKEGDDATPKPDANVGAEIINLGEIPLASLKELEIRGFVCDSGELKTLVDNAALLESLVLEFTQAPNDNSPRFNSTGVTGGTIRTFLEKPNKKFIYVNSCINYFNQEENDQLQAVQLLYPPRLPEEIGDFFRRFE